MVFHNLQDHELKLGFDRIIDQIKEESQKQVEKWGIQTHHFYKWLVIIAEEFGEINKAVLEYIEGNQDKTEYEHEINIENEFIQTITLLIKVLESFKNQCIIKDSF